MGMGLDLGTLSYLRGRSPDGYQRFRQDLVEVNRVLRIHGLPMHEEPESLPHLDDDALTSYPYSYWACLRRAVAHACWGEKKLSPLPPDATPMDQLYERVRASGDSHIVCHCDHAGFYVPIDFPKPLYDPLPSTDRRYIGTLGSSQGAMRELILVAPLLNIALIGGKLGKEQYDDLNRECERPTPLHRERLTWFAFHAAARLSIEYKTVIHVG